MTVADPVEGHVPIQECVGVTLAIQENTVPPVSQSTYYNMHTNINRRYCSHI